MNNAQNFTLQLSNTYPVPTERVFSAWTKPEELEKWWGPAGFKTTVVEMNVEVNGKYKYNMQSPDGQVHVITGQYEEIIKNEKLVFTWKWEHGDDETIVTVDFINKDDYTELVITHKDLPSEVEANSHSHGWTSFLHEGLKTYLA
jgi:uncharacterized protein YndB with AHSA1/START domain